jgi:hypothetical protein
LNFVVMKIELREQLAGKSVYNNISIANCRSSIFVNFLGRVCVFFLNWSFFFHKNEGPPPYLAQISLELKKSKFAFKMGHECIQNEKETVRKFLFVLFKFISSNFSHDRSHRQCRDDFLCPMNNRRTSYQQQTNLTWTITNFKTIYELLQQQ